MAQHTITTETSTRTFEIEHRDDARVWEDGVELGTIETDWKPGTKSKHYRYVTLDGQAGLWHKTRKAAISDMEFQTRKTISRTESIKAEMAELEISEVEVDGKLVGFVSPTSAGTWEARVAEVAPRRYTGSTKEEAVAELKAALAEVEEAPAAEELLFRKGQRVIVGEARRAVVERDVPVDHYSPEVLVRSEAGVQSLPHRSIVSPVLEDLTAEELLAEGDRREARRKAIIQAHGFSHPDLPRLTARTTEVAEEIGRRHAASVKLDPDYTRREREASRGRLLRSTE